VPDDYPPHYPREPYICFMGGMGGFGLFTPRIPSKTPRISQETPRTTHKTHIGQKPPSFSSKGPQHDQEG
jgi:hypothetical protein